MKWLAEQRSAKKSSGQPKRSTGGSVLVGIGLFMASLLDPKTKIQTELVDRKQSREHVDLDAPASLAPRASR